MPGPSSHRASPLNSTSPGLLGEEVRSHCRGWWGCKEQAASPPPAPRGPVVLSAADSVQCCQSCSYFSLLFFLLFLKTKHDKLIPDNQHGKGTAQLEKLRPPDFRMRCKATVTQTAWPGTWPDMQINRTGLSPRNKPLHLQSNDFPQGARATRRGRWSL